MQKQMRRFVSLGEAKLRGLDKVKNTAIGVAGLSLTLLLSNPASAQDAIDKEVGGVKTGSESVYSRADSVPANGDPLIKPNGVIGPPTYEPTVVQAIKTARIVRPSAVEAWRQIIAFGLAILGILGISGGGILLFRGFQRKLEGLPGAMKFMLSGAFIALAGLAMSGFVYLLLTVDMDCHLIE